MLLKYYNNIIKGIIVIMYLKNIISKILPPKYWFIAGRAHQRLVSIFYLGNQVICPCCNKSYREFLPYVSGKEKRFNCTCPNCGSDERQRLIWIYLKNRTDFFSKHYRVLHIAPEIYFQKIFRKMDNLDYISADLCSPIAMIKMDITDIEFEDNSFDIILCSHVLEHVLDDRLAIKELYRVLRPGGWGILQVPIDYNRSITYEDPSIVNPKAREKAFGLSDHVRMYGLDYKDRLEEAGFIVRIDDYSKELEYNKYGLSMEEKIYLCNK
jgi:predicted SAM-dependent methyltransferase